MAKNTGTSLRARLYIIVFIREYYSASGVSGTMQAPSSTLFSSAPTSFPSKVTTLPEASQFSFLLIPRVLVSRLNVNFLRIVLMMIIVLFRNYTAFAGLKAHTYRPMYKFVSVQYKECTPFSAEKKLMNL